MSKLTVPHFPFALYLTHKYIHACMHAHSVASADCGGTDLKLVVCKYILQCTSRSECGLDRVDIKSHTYKSFERAINLY